MTKPVPDISVLLCSYNRADTLKRCLEALEKQTLSRDRFEVICVNDGSTDHTSEVMKAALKRLPGSYHEHAKNQGLAAARNTAIRAARGRLVVFINDDTFPEPDFLEQHIQAHKAHPNEQTAIFGHIGFAREHAERILSQVLHQHNMLFPLVGTREEVPYDFNYFVTANLSVARQAFVSENIWFDETFRRYGCEDIEVGYRLWKRGYRVYYCPQAKVIHDHRLTVHDYQRRTVDNSSNLVQFVDKHPELVPCYLGVPQLTEPVLAQWRQLVKQEAPVIKKMVDRIAAAEDATPEALAGPNAKPSDAMKLVKQTAVLLGHISRHIKRQTILQILDDSPDVRYRLVNSTSSQPQSKTIIERSPLVSVIIPCYNYGCYLPEAVESVLNQTYQNFEIIIVNDGSPDDTKEVAEKLIAEHPQHQIRLINQANSGQPAIARNNGIAEAKGEYILPLDADDKLAPQAIESYIRAVEDYPEQPIVVFGWLQYFGVEENLWKTHPFSPDRLLRRTLLPYCSMFHRSVWEFQNGYSANVPGYEDWDFWVGAAKMGAKFINVPLVTAFYRETDASSLVDSARKRHEWLVAGIISNHSDIYEDEEVIWATDYLGRFPEAPEERQIHGQNDKFPKAAAVLVVSYQELYTPEEVAWAKQFLNKKPFKILKGIKPAPVKVDASCESESATDLDYFIKARQEFDKGNFETAVEYMQKYRLMMDYSGFPRILNKSGRSDDIKVSVIIVTYNRTQDLTGCLESLAKQDCADFETVVVDNGENDFEVFKQYVDQYVKCPINFVLSEGRNIGACCAKGKIIAFLDDDALVPPNYISSIKTAFETYDIFGLRGKVLLKSDPDANKEPRGYNLGNSAFPTFCDIEGNSAFLREVYISLDGMDPLLFGHEGIDLTYRIAKKYSVLNKVIYWPDTIIYHDAATGDSAKVKRDRYELMEKYLRFKHNSSIWALRETIEKQLLPVKARTSEKILLQNVGKSDRCLNMQVIGTEYGGWAVDLDLIPSGSTVISAGVGEDISFDLGLVNLKNCKVIGIDPTEKARKYVEQNKNENLSFLQKALYSQSNEKIRIYESSNPDWVSESITPSHNTVNPSDFYEAQTIGLQELLERHRDISVLKMDIEGAEYDVLNSIDKLDIPQICVEFHHFCTAFTVDDTDRCIEHLKDMGYIVAHCTYKAGAIKEVTFVHQKCIRRDAAATKPDTSAGRTVPDIPVILMCYNRPKHTLEVLRALKQHDVKNIYIFSDAPKRQEDTQAVSLVRRLVHSIDWTEPKIIERTENLGLARNIVSAVDYVFERYDRLILLEDDCVPQRYFFDFMQICLKKYENNPKVFGISGYTVAIPDEILRSYPYDLYACPRIGSWGWATWKRAWKHYGRDLRKLVKIADEGNVDLTQGGADIPIFIEKFLKGQLKDVWTLNWVLSVYINGGVYIYPTRSHIRNVGMDGIGLHCRRTDKYDSPCSNIRPTRYPEDIFLDERIMESFKSYYTAAPQRSRRAVHFLKSLRQKKSLKIAQINTVDKKGGAARVAWMLKEGLKDRGFQTKMFVKERFSQDSDVQTITNPAIDGGDDYSSKGFLYYDINSTFSLSRNNDFISSDVFHFHNLHGDYFNPFALPELTKIRPSVWTLHDMQSMTGHCAYAFDCPRWQSGCGDCPDPESYPAVTIDRTARMWEDKRRIYQKSDIELIVPSQWMKDVVKKSILKDKRVHLIYNGIDERIYRPYDKYAARKKLRIPDNSIVLGFVSHKGLSDRRKGGDFILEAYRYFISKYPNVYFVCIGDKSGEAPAERFLQIPYVLDENLLAEVYCAADVFMFPTLADNCPLVVLELMACGVPAVSFNVGGVPELIENGKTGFVAGYKNGPEFVQMTERLVLNRVRQKEFSHAGRERLRKMFTLERMIDEHVCLYEKLAENAEKKSYVPPKSKVALPASYSEVKYEYLVSAIVSTYNSERFLRGCLEDLENQTIADKLEIIVVNSGSQENEEAIVREYQQSHNNIVYIKTEHREEIYAAWNRAVKAVRGKFITNANTDDRHREDALEIMAKTLLANPDVALVYGDQICTDTPNGTFANHHATEIAKRPEYSQGRLLFGCCVGSQPMWRKSLHNEFGYFDDTLTCAADWDFWLRVSSRYKFKHIPECLGLYYYNKDGIEHGKKIHSLYERYIVGKRYGNPYISVIPLYQSRDNPLVSVIMPAYNAAEYIAEAIESILIQNYRNFELVVVDDGSTDNTRDIVASFKDDRIKYIYKENAGVASARNLAIKKSKGTFLINLDTDDTMMPDFIAQHLQEFEKHPEADLIYCDDCLIGEDDKPIRVIERPEYTYRELLIRDLFRCGFPLVPFRTCIRRSVFDKIGLFDEGLLVGEDYDMMRRFVKQGLKAHHLKGALYLRRMTPNSLSRNFTDEKAKCFSDILKRFTNTFSYNELFPNVAWNKIPLDMRQLHAKCLAAVTYVAIGQKYTKSNAPLYAKTACELACSELNDCLKMDPGNQRIRQLLQKCEFGRQKYDEQIQQTVR